MAQLAYLETNTRVANWLWCMSALGKPDRGLVFRNPVRHSQQQNKLAYCRRSYERSRNSPFNSFQLNVVEP